MRDHLFGRFTKFVKTIDMRDAGIVSSDRSNTVRYQARKVLTTLIIHRLSDACIGGVGYFVAHAYFKTNARLLVDVGV